MVLIVLPLTIRFDRSLLSELYDTRLNGLCEENVIGEVVMGLFTVVLSLMIPNLYEEKNKFSFGPFVFLQLN